MTLDPGFTTAEMAGVFSAQNRIALFCRFEAALAAAQAGLGEIPEEAASAIAAACEAPLEDAATILAEGWEVGTPVLALLERLRHRLPPEHAGSIHRGATSQDVVDTALMLQCAAALSTLDRSLASASGHLATLADEHRRTPTMGRTFLQEAVPTSFGFRFARWLQGLVGARRELRRVRAGLPLQLGGPVGDTASLGADASRVAEGMAGILALAVPEIPWHTDRRPVREVAGAAGEVAASASKIAGDVALLAASGEIRVRAGGSSSMSRKRNPIDAIRAEAAAEMSRAAVAGLMSAPSHDLERGMGSWHAEGGLVPIALQAAGAAMEAIDRCIASLEVVVPDRVEVAVGTDLIDRVLEAHRLVEGEG